MEGGFRKTNPSKNILSALYDVKPVKMTGSLNLSEIKMGRVIDLRKIKPGQEKKAIKPIALEDDFFDFKQPFPLKKTIPREQLVFPKEKILPKKPATAKERALPRRLPEGKSGELFFSERPALKPRPAPLERELSERAPSQERPFGLPSRDEILNELDQIEQEDTLLGAEEIKLVESPVSQTEEENLADNQKQEPIKVLEPKHPFDLKPEPSEPRHPLHLKSELIEPFFKNWQPQKEISFFPPQKFPDKLFSQPRKAIKPKYFLKKPLISFVLAGIFIALAIPGLVFLNQGLIVKQNILASGLTAYQNFLSAKTSLEQTDWQGAQDNFALAYSNFDRAYQEIGGLGKLVVGLLDYLGSDSLVSSGVHLIKIGQGLSAAGQELASAINSFSLNDLLGLAAFPNNQTAPLTERIIASQNYLRQALNEIKTAEQELSGLREINQPPLEQEISNLKEKLPLIEAMLEQTIDYSNGLLEFLGQNNPRQYLLVFQNNNEMRPTGGFIGTYGLLELDRGGLKKLFVDGVFNADGQLLEKIIPPQPIQKISTAWSMHDANWFADFPTSAQKIAWFYEKTGGPTVDGVIGLTPTVIERLLDLTGPISMPEYGVTLSSSNFSEIVQYKVEVDYDKELNQPKKILADFAPKFIEALANLSAENKIEAIKIIFEALKEKHLLVYFKDSALEGIAEKESWTGQLLAADKDYLSVVSTNINGFKTDRVVQETISHQALIQSDGSIIDTLTIRREHQGGHLAYDWFNRVNSDYLRVYLPLGSQLISATGQTLEQYQPPIDYQKHGFKADPLVAAIESQMETDPQTGTQIFEENGKTVFGNWLYVSPGKTAVLTYQYKLPFKIDLTKATDSYSLLAQKQSGSLGSRFSHSLRWPENWKLEIGDENWEGDLKLDRFLEAKFKF